MELGRLLFRISELIVRILRFSTSEVKPTFCAALKGSSRSLSIRVCCLNWRGHGTFKGSQSDCPVLCARILFDALTHTSVTKDACVSRASRFTIAPPLHAHIFPDPVGHVGTGSEPKVRRRAAPRSGISR